jgi:lipopolysaccharide biosynthesis glycosyltransferase
MNIIYSANSNYLPHLFTSIQSLLLHNFSSLLNIYIINADISPEEWLKLKKFEKLGNCKIIDLKISRIFKGLPLSHHYSDANYYRLYVADLLPDVERVLYLDADTIILANLKNIYSIELAENYLLAVRDPMMGRQKVLGMDASAVYFNTGGMLLNLSLWRRDAIGLSAIDFARANKDLVEFVDQDALNVIVNGRFGEISPVYNWQTPLLSMSATRLFQIYPDFELDLAALGEKIVHFTGGSKPWHLNNAHPFKSEYWHYRNMTIFRSALPDDFSVKELIKCITRRCGLSGQKKSME